MSNEHDNQDSAAEVIERLAAAVPALQPLEAGRTYRFVTDDESNVEDIDTEYLLPRPYRKQGLFVVHDEASLVLFVQKHQSPRPTEWASLSAAGALVSNAALIVEAVYGDARTRRVTAVMNDHGPGLVTTGWGDHLARLDLDLSPEWQLWANYDRKWLDQRPFAELVEEAADQVVNPPAAQMLDIAQTLQVHRSVEFKGQNVLHNGQVQIQYLETVGTSAGQRGDLTVPRELELALRVFEGDEHATPVKARLQFHEKEGHLQFRFLLTRTDVILRNAFERVLTDLEAQLGFAIFRGLAPGMSALDYPEMSCGWGGCGQLFTDVINRGPVHGLGTEQTAVLRCLGGHESALTVRLTPMGTPGRRVTGGQLWGVAALMSVFMPSRRGRRP